MGPRNARIKWSLDLPFSGGLKIVALGIDGTVYVTGINAGLCAIRNGKVAWAYSSGSMGLWNVQFDAEGRIWFESDQSAYCLNRDGKGGRLPSSFHPPKEQSYSLYRCNSHTLAGPSWQLDLDGRCTSAGVTTGPEGLIYVATDLPEILAVAASGAVKWRHTSSCNATRQIPTLLNRIIYTCEDRTLHALADGVENWTRTTDGVINRQMLADSAGTIYFGVTEKTPASHTCTRLTRVGQNAGPWTCSARWSKTWNSTTGASYISQHRFFARAYCAWANKLRSHPTHPGPVGSSKRRLATQIRALEESGFHLGERDSLLAS